MSAMKIMSRQSEEFAKEGPLTNASYPDISAQKRSDDIYEDGVIDPVYQAKARLLNSAIQEIGMGKYQVCPLTLCGAGYLKTPSPVVPLYCRWLRMVCVRRYSNSTSTKC
jgi:hypothetical protein